METQLDSPRIRVLADEILKTRLRTKHIGREQYLKSRKGNIEVDAGQDVRR